jgi:hypothetical protein
MSQPLGGVPPPNLTLMLPVIIQAHTIHFHRINDQNIAQYAREILNNIGVTPVDPIKGPGEANLDTPGKGADQGGGGWRESSGERRGRATVYAFDSEKYH